MEVAAYGIGCGYERATWGTIEVIESSVSWLFQCQYPGHAIISKW